jgi:putative chitinase
MEIQKLKGHVPDKVLKEIPSVVEKFQINTPLRLAHFISQCMHESDRFNSTMENLNYRDPERIVKIFRKFDLDKDKVVDPEELKLAEQYAAQPEKLANFVYANRMGNGDESSGDGWRHRGFGYLQLTGKNNQQAFFKSIGLDPKTHPSEIALKYPLLSAAWFFATNKLNQIADHGDSRGAVEAVTIKVNGGLHGIAERVIYFNKFYNILK